MDQLRKSMLTHPKLVWILVLAYTAFNGCFFFPFSNPYHSMDMGRTFTFLVAYGYIGIGFTGVLAKNKLHLVLALSFLFTFIGMGLRYWLEYGEISNVYNFTFTNIILYILVIPIYCTLVYWLVYQLNASSDT
ncbi:MAG: hypothetical protein E7231_12380 [Cellulosilyticum sp.]|nr:hypothetical protein [Cellulosilyticum sp.]